jgi:hypothetical protein
MELFIPTTVLSACRSEWLFGFPYSGNVAQGDMLRNHGGHQIKCNDLTPEDSKKSLPSVLSTVAASMEQGSYCEGD